MMRIYCDTNVFSYIEYPNKPEHEELKALLDNNKQNLSFFFSLAHIQDKENATKKDGSFLFMEQYVKDNFIHHYDDKQDTSMYLATPSIVGNDYNGKINPSSLFEPINEDDDEFSLMIKSTLQNTFSAINIPIGIGFQSSQPESSKNIISKIFPDSDNVSLLDLMRNITSFYEEINDDKLAYRELRTFLIEQFNKGKLKAENGDTEFNEVFKDTIFQKSFIEYVVEVTKQYQKKEKYTFYDFYLQSYSSIDMFGIIPEEISKKKKNGFPNMIQDSFHSYYASYCDMLITDDIGLQSKSKSLYNLYGRKTKIVNICEAIGLIKDIENDEEKSISDVLKKVKEDIELGQGYNTGEKYGEDEMILIEARKLYLNYFDGLLLIKSPDGNYHIILVKDSNEYLTAANFRETEGIVNKCVKLLGTDCDGHDTFNWEKEVEEIKKDNWNGRGWYSEGMLMYIAKNPLLAGRLTFGIRSLIPSEGKDNIDKTQL